MVLALAQLALNILRCSSKQYAKALSCCGGLGVWGIAKTDAFVGFVEGGVKVLDKGKTVDKVEPLARGAAEVFDIINKVDVSGDAGDFSVGRAGEGLSIGSELKDASTIGKEPGLKGIELGRIDAQETGRVDLDSTSCRMVLSEGVSGEDES